MTIFAPIAPTVAILPLEIAKDTFVIHQVQEALGQQLFGCINSMVILGAESLIVDTGTPADRQQLSSGAPTAYRTGAGTEGR